MKTLEEIIGLEVVCEMLGTSIEKEIPAIVREHLSDDEIAYKEWKLVVRAMNFVENDHKEWEPNWHDSTERKYEPWVWIKATKANPAGSGFSRSDYGRTYAFSLVGSRLCFKSLNGWNHAYEHFQPILKRFMLISK